MNVEEVRLAWLFLVGVFLSFLFYLSEIINQNELIQRLGVLKVATLVVINSLLGGFVMVATFYLLDQFFGDWHEYLKVGVSGFVAMAGKDAVHIYHKLIKQKAGG